MKAIIVRQPWASLIAAGVKTIETRPRQTHYRGRIAIHAAKGGVGIDPVSGYGVGTYDDGEALWRILRPVPQAGPCYEVVHGIKAARGAVVASAVLIDCVPVIGNEEEMVPPSFIGEFKHEGDMAHQQGGLWLIGSNDLTHGKPTRVTDQLPFGDFSPGRWALLLDDIAPTTDRCPWCWGDGLGDYLLRDGDRNIYDVCVICGGNKRCPPVPARGQQAIPWEWTP